MEQRAAALLVLQAVRQPRPRVLLRLNRVNRQKEEIDKGSCLGHWSRRGLAGVASTTLQRSCIVPDCAGGQARRT